jgi:hypothetical protein
MLTFDETVEFGPEAFENRFSRFFDLEEQRGWHARAVAPRQDRHRVAIDGPEQIGRTCDRVSRLHG